MTKHNKAFLTVLAVAAVSGAWMIYAQTTDEGSQVVKEEMVVEDAVVGVGNGAKAAPEAEVKPEEAKPAAELPVEEPAVKAPAAAEGTEAKPADKSLEQVVAEIIGESKTTPPAETKPAPGPAGAEAVKETPVAEVAAETPAPVVPAAEAPAAEPVKEVKEVAPAPEAVKEAAEIPKLEKNAPGASDSRMAEVVALKEREELRRKAYEGHATDLVEAGEAALEARKYPEARAAFQEAVKMFSGISRRENQSTVARARLGLQACIYNQAMSKLKEGDLAAAEQMATEAKQEGHPKAAALLKEIARLKAKPPPPPAAPPHRWDAEDFKQREKKIQEKMQAGRDFFASGEFDKAIASFEVVLKMDPQNTEAIRWREKTAQRTYTIASQEFVSTSKDMVSDVRRAWNPRDYGVGDFSGVSATNLIPDPKRSTDEKRRRNILEKMDKIIIPEVDFRQANINDVIDFLEKSSREFDTSEEENKGINIILNLGSAGAAPAAAPAAPAEGAAPAPAEGTSEAQLITFKARDISLMEALRIVTSVANLKYSIQGNVVMIVGINTATEPIVHRSYDVLASVGERIVKITQELPKGAAGELRKIGEEAAVESTEVDWKQFFTRMGVQWPDGSSIQYLPSIGKIMVANTAENLAIFEQRLADINVVPNQIEIEARFVEVEQTDLSSLGFEWLLTDDWELAHKDSPFAGPGGAERIVIPANTGPLATRGGFTKGLRVPTDGINRILPGMRGEGALNLVQDNVLTIASVLTNPELTMILHLLQQKGNTDMLSAPKVTTQSGVEATIKVVTEYIYPTEFDVTPILANDIAGRLVPVGGIVEPGSFETREVGVILQVMPEVSAEGQMISLTLAPEVVSEPIWKDYGSTFTLPDGSTTSMPMPQPFFPTRSISTSIIIYNGATVVMGGMITESHNSVDDKIPLLGDIPLIGRLFQSKVDQSQKRNLLVFVTARLVDPAGRAVGATKLPL